MGWAAKDRFSTAVDIFVFTVSSKLAVKTCTEGTLPGVGRLERDADRTLPSDTQGKNA
jgi:hypothetical protein